MPYIVTNTTRLGHMTGSAFTALSTSASSPPFPVFVVVAIIAMLIVALAIYAYIYEAHTVTVDDKELQVYELGVLGRYCRNVNIVVAYSPVSSRTAREFVDNSCAGKIHPRAMSLDSVYSASTFRASVHVNDDPHLQELRAHSLSPSFIPTLSLFSSPSYHAYRVRITPLSQDEQDITNAGAGASFGPGTHSLRAYEGRNRPRPTRTRVCTPPLQLFATAAQRKGELDIADAA